MAISFLHWNSAVTGFARDETEEYNRTFRIPDSVHRRNAMNDENATQQESNYPYHRVTNHLLKVMEDDATPDKGEHAAELLIMAMRLQLDRENSKL